MSHGLRVNSDGVGHGVTGLSCCRCHTLVTLYVRGSSKLALRLLVQLAIRSLYDTPEWLTSPLYGLDR